MAHEDFGALVRALRSQGPQYRDGARTTQARLGEAIHRDEAYIGRLERGEIAHLHTDLLLALADAFNLTTLERKEFFFAAVGVEDDAIVEDENAAIAEDKSTSTALDDLIAHAEQIPLPAFIVDAYADMVAANHAVLRMFEVSEATVEQVVHLPAGMNMMHFLFSPRIGFRALVGDDIWNAVGLNNVLFFRRASLRYRHTAYFKHLLDALTAIDTFNTCWGMSFFVNDYLDAYYTPYEYQHDTLGDLRYYGVDVPETTRFGDLYLVNYVPIDERTNRVFARLIEEHGTAMRRFAPWPEKPF